MKKNVLTAIGILIISFIYAQDWNPSHPSWTDSYEANGFCWCNSTNYDHGLDQVSVEINGVDVNIVDLCDELKNHPDYRAYQNGDAPYNDIQCGNGPANDAADETGCPGRTDLGSSGCFVIGPNWDMDWLETRFGANCSSDFDAFSRISAADYCNNLDVKLVGSNVGYINNGDWISFENVDFGSGADSITASVSCGGDGGNIEVRQGSSSGNLLGTINVSNTGSWTTWDTVSADIRSVSGEQDIYLVFTGGSGYLLDISWFQFSQTQQGTTGFVPDPNKTYYIDSAYFSNTRLAATGESEDAYTTSTTTTGANVEWKFVAKAGTDSWHIQRAAGGSLPRLRSDNSDNADMQATSSSGTYTYFDFTEGDIAGSYFITLPNGPGDYVRLQIDNNKNINMVGNNRNGTWESFIITEASGTSSSTPSCSSGANLSLNGSIVDFSTEQNSTNTVNNILDGNDANRWSALGFPQYAVVDLGTNYAINEVDLSFYYNRGYEYTVEGSTAASSGYSTLTNGTGEGSNSFSTAVVRYVKLTITSGGSYTGSWSSVTNFEINCAGTSAKSLIADEIFEVTTYPNPFVNSLNVSVNESIHTIGSLQLTDITGKVIAQKTINGTNGSIDNLGQLAKGLYLLQVLNSQNQVITTKKIVK